MSKIRLLYVLIFGIISNIDVIISQNYFVDTLNTNSVTSTFTRLAYPTDICVRITAQNEANKEYALYQCLPNGSVNKTVYTDDLCTQIGNSPSIMYNESASFGELYEYNCNSDILSYITVEWFSDNGCSFSNGKQYIATDICYQDGDDTQSFNIYNKATCVSNMAQLVTYSDSSCSSPTSAINFTSICEFGRGIQSIPNLAEYNQLISCNFITNVPTMSPIASSSPSTSPSVSPTILETTPPTTLTINPTQSTSNPTPLTNNPTTPTSPTSSGNDTTKRELNLFDPKNYGIVEYLILGGAGLIILCIIIFLICICYNSCKKDDYNATQTDAHVQMFSQESTDNTAL